MKGLAKKKPKAKSTTIQYLAEFKYESEGVEEIIAEFAIAVLSIQKW